MLQTWKMVCGLPELFASTIVCFDCVKGKQHREPMSKKSQWRASHKLQLVHANICGPITPPSNNQNRHILCFIDDYSRKAWVYFLLKKSEAFYHFKCLLRKKLDCISNVSVQIGKDILIHWSLMNFESSIK